MTNKNIKKTKKDSIFELDKIMGAIIWFVAIIDSILLVILFWFLLWTFGILK